MIGPDSGQLLFVGVISAGLDRNTAGFNEEIKLTTTQEGDPIKPLYTSSKASGIDDRGREAIWGKGNATAS